MRCMLVFKAVTMAVVCFMTTTPSVAQSLSADHKRELAAIRRDLSKVAFSIRQSKLDEAAKTIDDAEQRLDRVAQKAKLPANSRLLTGLRKMISTQRHALEFKKDPKKAKERNTVSFVKHVAPILQKRCVECHGAKDSGKLRLDSFANMKKGGQSGPLLYAGNASRSLFILRLCTPLQKMRMPKGEGQLPPAEINVIALWVEQGAKYDGEDDETELAELIDPKKQLPPLKGWEATGKETVSFKKHIAPWMVTVCLRCHEGNKPQGGLSLESYDAMMRGGKSGKVVIPGRPEESLMYQLVGSFDEARRMPANRSRLLRRNWDDLGVWIHEGAKFDGADDPRILLRAINPTAGQRRASQLAAMTPDQFIGFRETRTTEQWDAVLPDLPPTVIKTDEMLFCGNVPTDRMEQVRGWAEGQLKTLRRLFTKKETSQGRPKRITRKIKPKKEPEKKPEPIWKGRLSVFVLRSRAEFERFSEAVAQRRVFEESFGIVNITPAFEDAMIVVYDTGDEADELTPSLELVLLDQLTTAYLDVSDVNYPQWFALGLGPASYARDAKHTRDVHLAAKREAAVGPIKELEKPADVFKNGAFFSDEAARPVGFTLVEFLLEKGGGETRMNEFINAFRESGSVANSLRVVYRSEPDAIAKSYLTALQLKIKQGKRK